MDALESRKVRLLTAEVAGLRDEVATLRRDSTELYNCIIAVSSDVDWVAIRHRNFVASLAAALARHQIALAGDFVDAPKKKNKPRTGARFEA